MAECGSTYQKDILRLAVHGVHKEQDSDTIRFLADPEAYDDLVDSYTSSLERHTLHSRA